MREVAVIGLGTGGIHAVRTMTSFSRDVHITVFEERNYPTYSPCGLPYAIEGHTDTESIKHPFPTGRKVELKLSTRVKKVIHSERKLLYEGPEGEGEHQYDILVYAAGSEPAVPPIEGLADHIGNGVYTLKVVEDAEAILKAVEGANSAGVIGGGAIGLETAAALKKRIGEVHVFEMLSEIMPNLDPDMGKIVREILEEKEIAFHTGTTVKKVKRVGGKMALLYDGGEYLCDIVILSTGIRPRTGLLDGIVETERGYIKVDDHMRAGEDLYAVGDCVTTYNTLYNEYRPAPYATAAMKQGITAGMNIAGIDARYTGATYSLTSVIGDLEVASTGIGSQGDLKSVRVKHLSKPSFMGGKELVFKLIFDEGGGIKGAQAVGEGATASVNYISMLMKKNPTLADIVSAEIAYCPGISELLNVLQMAGEMGMRRLKSSPLLTGVEI